ncbi:MAG: hypothetical protein JWP30_1470 [Homoserinimonas sp.]|nr:hypothetical protein [Homoserinimonas sp.]
MMAVGCSAGATPDPNPTAAYVSDYKAPAPTEIAPLRGTTVAEGSLSYASVAAKIDNHWDARPQIGLEKTDLVFEELVEGGITRYVAVWHSEIPDLMGPVRSIRPMDPDIAGPFGIIFYAGGQPKFVSMMQDTPVYNASHGQGDTADYMFRTPDKAAPHNVLTKAKEFVAAHGDIAAPRQQFAFSLDVPSSTAAKEGTPTAGIRATFSDGFHPTWHYDVAQQAFLRSQDDAPDLDSNGNQLKATNIVVLRVPVTHATGVPKTELLGSGEAWVSTGGGTIHAVWHKAAATDPIRLLDDNGVAVRLAAGNTWIELVPTVGDVTFTAP